jgi:pyruvate/2-oxoglutarate dehydrogenase complex dihydrolipoamide dehydrogenase (E3) component
MDISDSWQAEDRSVLEYFRPARWQNPKPASLYDLVILGGGAAGLTAAFEAAKLGSKVALVERKLLGGNCLHIGCVPSKTIIRTSRLYADMRNAENFGGQVPGDITIDFAAAMERVHRVTMRIGRPISPRELNSLGIDLFFGEGQFSGPNWISVEAALLRFKKALIATGAHPIIPPIRGLAEAGYLTNESIFDMRERPVHLLVIGGGPIGCELSQAFCRLGSKVTIVETEPMFLGKEERDAAQILSDSFARDGIEIHLNTDTTAIRVEGKQKLADLVSEDSRSTIEADQVLVGVGQRPNVETLNLQIVGVDCDPEEGVRVNDFLQTTNPDIYAAGDVSARRRFNHFEAASSRIVVENALRSRRRRVSALTIPWCTYTDPEIAHVGLYVREAREKNIPVKTFTVPMHDVHRAICDAEEEGFVKIHVREGSDRILGATVVARHAGEMINDISLALRMGIGLGKLGEVVRPYPTQAAAIQMAAEAYQAMRSASPYQRQTVA